jgi:hypothetical protein
MIFCDSFSIQDNGSNSRLGKQLGLTLWPVSSRPLKSSIQSLSVIQLSDQEYLKDICVLAVFSWLLGEDDHHPQESFQFPVDHFRLNFTPDSFNRAINLPNEFGFCYVLNGTNATVLSRARCLSFPPSIGVRRLTGKKSLKCQPLFDLFPSLSAFALRFPVHPPPLTKTSFVPFRPCFQKFTETRSVMSLPWAKADKLERWRAHLSQVTANLFIGSDLISSQVRLLRENGITHIINCVAQLVESPSGFTCLQIPMADGGDENILSHIFGTTVFIQKALAHKGKVLVHCIEGASRSVSVLIGYLILTENLDYSSAFSRVRAKRRVANPNPKFMAQLIQLTEIVGSSSSRTCFFSRKKLIPFEIMDRGGSPIPVPVYGEPDPDRDVCLITVIYRDVDSLWKKSTSPPGTIEITATDAVPADCIRAAQRFAVDVCQCLRIVTDDTKR